MIHARKGFVAFHLFSVQLLFACRPMKNHSCATCRQAHMASAAPPAIIIQVIPYWLTAHNECKILWNLPYNSFIVWPCWTVKSRSHLHANHVHTMARSFDEGHHKHDSNEMKKLRSIIDEARSEVANVMDMEKRLKSRLKMSDPSFMHNLVFRLAALWHVTKYSNFHEFFRLVLHIKVWCKPSICLTGPWSRCTQAESIRRGWYKWPNLCSFLSFHLLYLYFGNLHREHISAEDFELQNIDANLEGTALQRGCGQQANCPASPPRFRTQDGTCNNPDPSKSTWGAAGTPMERLLPPSYEDGIWEPRTYSVDGSHLTNARTISRILLADVDRPHSTYNLLFMQFGQWITHDVTQSASITNGKIICTLRNIQTLWIILFIADGEPVSCCSEDGSSVLPQHMLHYACQPIEIEPEDEYYSHFNQGCINFVRSALSVDNECKLGYGKQVLQELQIGFFF